VGHPLRGYFCNVYLLCLSVLLFHFRMIILTVATIDLYGDPLVYSTAVFLVLKPLGPGLAIVGASGSPSDVVGKNVFFLVLLGNRLHFTINYGHSKSTHRGSYTYSIMAAEALEPDPTC